MKRSKMVEIIADTILFKTDLLDSQMVSDFDCSIILSVLEESGMLPPMRKEVLGTMDNGDPFYYYIYEWENEE